MNCGAGSKQRWHHWQFQASKTSATCLPYFLVHAQKQRHDCHWQLQLSMLRSAGFEIIKATVIINGSFFLLYSLAARADVQLAVLHACRLHMCTCTYLTR